MRPADLQPGPQVAQVTDRKPRTLTDAVAPRALSLVTFLGGAILLYPGAIPPAAGPLAALSHALPLGNIEASQFIGSVVGAALLVVSHGLSRRRDAAFVLAVLALAVEMLASLMRAARYEEAAALTLLLAVVWRSRGAFDRRAAFFETRFSKGWLVAVVCALGASIWIGFFAGRHVEYTRELWWQFGVDASASRLLRVSVGAAVFLLILALGRLLAPAAPDLTAPTDVDLAAAEQIIERQPWTAACLAFLRDKALLFDDARQAFIMYGVQGQTWIALGDPVGPRDRASGLVRRFLGECDAFGGVPVFYEVRREYLRTYADFGLACVQVGEEARVDLTAFTLSGGAWSKQRQHLHRLERDHITFRVVPRADAPAIMAALQTVSDDWLAAKAGGEKSFSLGSFRREYLSRFDIAVVERAGRIIAFANLWAGPEGFELATDLIRYHRSAPPETMEALLLQVMIWGRSRSYHWFSLGVAPLAGLGQSAAAPLWSRIGSFLYAHGEGFYRFRGLRAFKEKFHPQWEPRYLVYPGGLTLPRVVADLSALIAGGYHKVLLK